MSDLRDRIIAFSKNEKDTPFMAAIASALYPLLFYYNANFTVLNSWEQLVFFIIYFLGIPIVVFKLSTIIVSRILFFNPIKAFVLPILNFIWFGYLMVIITEGFRYKYIAVIVFVALLFAVIFRKHFKKIIVFQFLLAIMVAIPLLKYMFFDIQNTDAWTNQPDDIENIIFKSKPNIYFIQPDGYANFSEINKGYYNNDNSEFKNYLLEHDFSLYDDYRSNYYSTLSSNSALFAMKHHYHNFPTNNIREVYNARDVIVGNNPVIEILKRNHYKTYLLLHKSYMFINQPQVAYDYSNINRGELSYFSRGFQMTRDIFSDLKALPEDNDETPKFYFLEQISPGHITNKEMPGNVADTERDNYMTKLKEANIWLKEVINYIEVNDPNSLIVISADHGGFVGMNTTFEARSKLTDRDMIYSIFTAQLAIKWPNNEAPIYDKKLKTPVNVFRILFSYLSENEAYLENLQDDKSYIQIESGAPFGVYEYINENGEVVFSRVYK